MNHTFKNSVIVVLLFSSTICFTSCKKESSPTTPPIPPIVITANISGITSTTASTGGNVKDDGGAEVSEKGVCWSTTQNPTISDNKNIVGSGFGAFTSVINGLNQGTTYFIRAYAVNSEGVFYGNELSLITFFEQGGSLTQKADFPGVVRYSAAGFSIGTKVYIGLGYTDDESTLKDFWEWDQATNVWTRKADYPGNSSGATVSFSIGTKGYIGYGNDNNTNEFTNEFWEYDPGTNSWTQKASLPLKASRIGAVGFSIGTKGYIGLGVKDSVTAGGFLGYYQDFWEWDQATNVWTKKADFGGNARDSAVGFSIGNKGYIGTGDNYGDNITSVFKDFWEWDQATNVWTKKADFGGNARADAIGFSIGSKGYIGNGNSGTNYSKDFWEWDQATNAWKEIANFGGMIGSQAVGFSIGNKGYIGTGSGDNGPSNKDFWEMTTK